MDNSLLFRRTERELGSSLSGVVHAIGSQSTKGMALLCSVGAKTKSWGVWQAANVTLFETYPNPCLRSKSFVEWMQGLKLSRDIRQWYTLFDKETDRWEQRLLDQNDIFDAGVCACVARAFAEGTLSLKKPPAEDTDNEQNEGWIFYPDDRLVQIRDANNYKNIVNSENVETFHDAIQAFKQHLTARTA